MLISPSKMMDEYANLHYLEELFAKNWWTISLRSSTDERIGTIKRLKSTSTMSNLCHLCRVIDWEYLIFGSENTGFKKAFAETVCLGPRSEVLHRAHGGCPVCTNIVQPLVEDVEQRFEDPQTREGCVHIDVSESSTQEAAPLGNKSYVLYASVRPQEPTKGHQIGVVNNDENSTSRERGFASRLNAVLIDSDLSMYRSVSQYVDHSRCCKWLDTCFSQHELCNTAHERDESSPIKLIDVNQRCVVHFPRKGHLQYVALSYVCGPGYSLCILQGSNAWKRDPDGNSRHPLPISMPATLEDAISVTKSLNITYLWVDSICIAQDDEAEKSAQIGRMFHIYNDASVCIISAAGTDSHTPLAGVPIARTQSPHRKVTIKNELHLGLPFASLGTVLAEYRYMERAWTYQELLLSKRTIIFTAEECFFYCAQSTSRESRVERQGQDLEAETWASIAPESKSHLIGNAVTMRKTTDPAQLCRLFAAAAQEYSSRKLSFQEDAINAFYGMLSLFEQLFSRQSICACPESMLLNCFTWRDPRVNTPASELSTRRMCKKISDTAVLPSWTWSSYDGPMHITAIPYCYTQSACQIYRPPSLPNQLVKLFPRVYDGLCCTCCKTEHQIKVLHPMPLIVRTKTITMSIDADGDDEMMPGQADLSTIDGQYLGPCDFRGQSSLNQLHRTEVTFMQIYAAHSKNKPTHVAALVLRSCRLLDSLQDVPGAHVQDVVTNLVQPQNKLTQIAIEPPLSSSATNSSFSQSLLHEGCPEALQNKADSKLDPKTILVASRLGIAFINYKQWTQLQSRDSILFLI